VSLLSQNPDHELKEASESMINDVIGAIVNAVNLHHLKPDSITAATSLRDGGLQLDSIDILEVVVAIEHHFGVKVGGAEVAREHFRTIGQIARYVQSLKSKG
jgi:acyl carrier protein